MPLFISSLSQSRTKLCVVSLLFRVAVCVHAHPTHYDTVLSNVDIRANLCCIDHTVLLDEDMISDVQWEEGNSGKSRREWREKQIKIMCLLSGNVAAGTYN